VKSIVSQQSFSTAVSTTSEESSELYNPNIDYEAKINQGGFSTVYKGTYANNK